MTPGLVSIIIVNWNGKKHLEKCLPSIFKITYKPYEVILVDNGSVDDSVEFVTTNFPQVKIVRSDTNLGFVGGNNLGYKYVDGEYVLFINNDTTVEPNFLEILVRELALSPEIGMTEPKIVLMDDPARLDFIGSYLTNWGLLYHYGWGKSSSDSKYNQKTLIFSARGACMLFKKSVLDKIGLFDEDFFSYGEETDLCHRAWLAGYKLFYIPTAVIYHKVGGTSGPQLKAAFTVFHYYKNQVCAYLKNLSPRYLILLLPPLLLLYFIYGIIVLLQGKGSQFWAICRSLGWNVANLGKTLAKRKNVQVNIRRVSDSQIMPEIKKSVRLSYFYYLLKGLNYYQD